MATKYAQKLRGMPCARVFDDDGETIIGFANEMSNGMWGAFNVNDRRITPVLFPTWQLAAKWIRSPEGRAMLAAS